MGRGRNTEMKQQRRQGERSEQTHDSGCPHQSHPRSHLPHHTPRVWRCSGGCCTQTAQGSRTCLGEEERRAEEVSELGRCWGKDAAAEHSQAGPARLQGWSPGSCWATACPNLAVPTCHATGTAAVGLVWDSPLRSWGGSPFPEHCLEFVQGGWN